MALKEKRNPWCFPIYGEKQEHEKKGPLVVREIVSLVP